MAVGLILGVEAEPTQDQFQELLDKGFVQSEGITFQALSVSTLEAADRSHLRELYKAACAKEEWWQGIELAETLEFADLVVQGGRLVLVTPPTAPPQATPGGLIAGIGFTPGQADLQALGERVGLHPQRQYALTSFSEAEARDELPLIAAYLGTARRQGWSSVASKGVSVTRHPIEGKQYIVIEPGEPTKNADAPSPPDTDKKPGWFRRRSHRSQSG